MNDRCRRWDCIYRKICQCMFDLVDCSAYKNTGEVPDHLRAIGPTDRQKALFPRNEGWENKPAAARARKQVKA